MCTNGFNKEILDYIWKCFPPCSFTPHQYGYNVSLIFKPCIFAILCVYCLRNNMVPSWNFHPEWNKQLKTNAIWLHTTFVSLYSHFFTYSFSSSVSLVGQKNSTMIFYNHFYIFYHSLGIISWIFKLYIIKTGNYTK